MDFATFSHHVRVLASARAWITEPGLALYVRKPLEGVRPPGVDFDLADMTATKPGQGAFSAFLDRNEARYGFWVENIINPRLIVYLERRGYRCIAPQRAGYSVCMFRERGDPCVGSVQWGAGSGSMSR